MERTFHVVKREDIEKEIRSTIQDILDDRSQESERAVDEALTLEILQEFGSPEKVAESYLTGRYLIGPRLSPTFSLVLRIALPILAVLGAIGFGLLYTTNPPSHPTEALFQSLVELVNSLIQAFGTIVLIFAILQWLLPKLEVKNKAWDARGLLEIKPSDHLPLTGAVVEVIFSAGAIIIFNFYPDILRLWNNTDGVWQSIEILSPAFFAYIPAWTIIWALTVVLNIYLIRQGRWNVWTSWASAVLKTATIVLATVMLAGPALVQVDSAALAGLMPAETQSIHDWFAKSIQMSVRLVLVIILISEGIDLVKTLLRIFEKDLPSFTLARQ